MFIHYLSSEVVPLSNRSYNTKGKQKEINACILYLMLKIKLPIYSTEIIVTMQFVEM